MTHPLSVCLLFVFLWQLPGCSSRTAEEWKDRVIYQIMTDRFAVEPVTDVPCGNLSWWCGGNIRGLIDKLDYIQQLGANAVWISPINEQTEGGYHGYSTKNMYERELRFGTDEDYHDLVREAHSRDIWIMVDVIPNHMGYPSVCQGQPVCDNASLTDFSEYTPYDEPQHYHELCWIDWDGGDQTNMELCRLANLPDLNQSDPYVRESLYDWIANLTATFDFDGYRIDTVKHVAMEFWPEYQARAGALCMGEVWYEQASWYPAQYQGQGGLDSVFNHPMFGALHAAFYNGDSMTTLHASLKDQRAYFEDVSVLGLMIDNHDVQRFLNVTQDHAKLRSALTYVLFGQGIPVIYYGTEQLYHGGSDPNNRESLWPNYNTGSPIYKFIAELVALRAELGVARSGQTEYHTDADSKVFAWQRADHQVMVLMTNQGKGFTSTVSVFNVPEGTDGVATGYEDALSPGSVLRPDGGGTLRVPLTDGEPTILRRVDGSTSGATQRTTGLAVWMVVVWAVAAACGSHID